MNFYFWLGIDGVEPEDFTLTSMDEFTFQDKVSEVWNEQFLPFDEEGWGDVTTE